MQRHLITLVLPAILLLSACAPDTGHPIQKLKIKRHRATIPEKRSGADWWMKRNRILNERAKQADVELAFLGDSITEAWEKPGADALAKAFGTYKTAILGIGGDQTQHILWRVRNGHFKTIRPRLVILLAGTNNLQDTPQQKVDGIIRIIQEINKRTPETRILLLGIFPRSHDPDNEQRLRNVETNNLLAELDDGHLIHYRDIGNVFLQPDGSIAREVMRDFLHLTPKGYQLWAEAIADDVHVLMQTTPPQTGD